MLSYFNCKWASFLTSISLLASVTRGQVQSDIEEHAQEPNKVNDVFDEIVKTAPSLAPLQVNSDGIGYVITGYCREENYICKIRYSMT